MDSIAYCIIYLFNKFFCSYFFSILIQHIMQTLSLTCSMNYPSNLLFSNLWATKGFPFMA